MSAGAASPRLNALRRPLAVTSATYTFLAVAVGACVPVHSAPISTSVPTASNRPPANYAAYEFPATIDPAARYLFYLHGKIIEDQGIPAVSPEFGEYEYWAILKKLSSHGLIVISEQRAKDTDADAYAERIRHQILLLLQSGVAPGHITVVGASQGASIAADASYLLGNPSVNFVLLASCPSSMIDEWKRKRKSLYGNILSIRDAADHEYSGPCTELFRMSTGRGLGRSREIVLNLGLGHGIVYKPLDDWILPVVEWSGN